MEYTKEDIQLIELAGIDKTDSQSAEILGVSKNAVEKRWSKLRRKANAHTRSAVIFQYCAWKRKELSRRNEIFNRIPVAVILFSPNMEVLDFNKAARNLLGARLNVGSKEIAKYFIPAFNGKERMRRERINQVINLDFKDYRIPIKYDDGEVVNTVWWSTAATNPLIDRETAYYIMGSRL